MADWFVFTLTFNVPTERRRLNVKQTDGERLSASYGAACVILFMVDMNLWSCSDTYLYVPS